jgi:pyruvate kinase
MVARGDLGVELAPELVPIVQKQIIELANKKSKLVITATQMLESMIDKPRPTRAEASDVANAVFDGTDALMLSGETAVGSYPVEAVQMMSSIIEKAESENIRWGRWNGVPEIQDPDDDTVFVTRAATELANDKNVAALAVFTESGRTAVYLSKERPVVPILACTSDRQTYQQLNLYWGIEPIIISKVDTIDELVTAAEKAIVNRFSLQPGQQVIFTFGYPVQKGRSTNMAYLHTIGV